MTKLKKSKIIPNWRHASVRLARRYPVARALIKKLIVPYLSYRSTARVRGYRRWLRTQGPTEEELAMQRRLSKGFAHRPRLSIVVPTYDTPAEYLQGMIDSVLSQTYDNWELILVDDASPSEAHRARVEEAARLDERISSIMLKRNLHIAGATNHGIQAATGEFIGLLDHDDVLYPDALYEVASVINRNPSANFIYTDEDKVFGSSNQRSDPFFKPDWNPDLLWSINYITHFSIIRKTILDKVGGEDGKYNGAQDWQLFMKVARTIDTATIVHIPKILYGWRLHDGSTSKSGEAKPYVVDAQRAVINEDLRLKGLVQFEVVQNPVYPGQWDIKLRNNTKTLDIAWMQASDDVREFVSSTKAQLIVVTEESGVRPDHSALGMMATDAQRPEIGCVVARYAVKEQVIDNIRTLIAPAAVEYVAGMSDAEISRHYYHTSRYNLPKIIRPAVFMIETVKLRRLLEADSELATIDDIATAVRTLGLRNLYNPSLEVVK